MNVTLKKKQDITIVDIVEKPNETAKLTPSKTYLLYYKLTSVNPKIDHTLNALLVSVITHNFFKDKKGVLIYRLKELLIYISAIKIFYAAILYEITGRGWNKNNHILSISGISCPRMSTYPVVSTFRIVSFHIFYWTDRKKSPIYL